MKFYFHFVFRSIVGMCVGGGVDSPCLRLHPRPHPNTYTQIYILPNGWLGIDICHIFSWHRALKFSSHIYIEQRSLIFQNFISLANNNAEIYELLNLIFFVTTFFLD